MPELAAIADWIDANRINASIAGVAVLVLAALKRRVSRRRKQPPSPIYNPREFRHLPDDSSGRRRRR